MNIKEMFTILTQMPLIQGLNGLDLARIEERLNLRINIIEASSHPFIRQGEICNELIFITHGTILKESLSADSIYSTIEEIPSPCIIEPEQLYGLTCRYANTYQAKTDCNYFKVTKKDVTRHLMSHDIFRINYMNMLSAQLHKLREQKKYKQNQTARDKVINFIRDVFQPTWGEKILRIKMTDLANYIGETRLTVSNILNEMNQEGMVVLKRKEIIIPHIQTLNEKK